ncbi:type II secretion system protein [Leptothoe sp. ISB3NOV94-8A]
MVNYHSKILLHRWLLQRRKHKASGFTLTEVLISVAIAGVIVSGLLSLVVELLQIDRREITLERVQRDMQQALDYISDDLEEAVYVYDNTRLLEIVEDIDELNDRVGAGGEGTGDAVPLLAFWRTVPLDDADLEDCNGTDEACRVARTRRTSYSLVVYLQQHRDDADADSAWQGQSVIRRYELPEYPDTANFSATDLDEETSEGYVNPVDSLGKTNFEVWAPNAAPAVVAGESPVLVDFVREADIDAPNAIDCRALIFDLNSRLIGEIDPTANDYDYVLSPAEATEETGFFACIQEPQLASGSFRSTQDVYLFLRGNAQSENRFLGPAGKDSSLPVLQTQVKLRGVIDKDG